MNGQQRRIGWALVIIAVIAVLAIGGVLFAGRVNMQFRPGYTYETRENPSSSAPPLAFAQESYYSGVEVSAKGVIYAIGSLALVGLLIGFWLFILAGQKDRSRGM